MQIGEVIQYQTKLLSEKAPIISLKAKGNHLIIIPLSMECLSEFLLFISTSKHFGCHFCRGRYLWQRTYSWHLLTCPHQYVCLCVRAFLNRGHHRRSRSEKNIQSVSQSFIRSHHHYSCQPNVTPRRLRQNYCCPLLPASMHYFQNRLNGYSNKNSSDKSMYEMIPESRNKTLFFIISISPGISCAL